VRNDTHHRTRTLWLSSVLHGFTHMYQVALLPLYLRIQQDLRLGSIEQATLLVTVMGVAYFLPSYPLGVMADRLSRKRLMGAGLAINGLGFVGLALSPNYAWALASVVVAGFGGSFYHPAATALIARLFPEARGRALGLAGIGASAGFFLGPIYCGWRVVSCGNWRSPVLELGIAGLVAAGLFSWLAEEEQQSRAERPACPADGARRDALHCVGDSHKLFPTPVLWVFFLAASVLFSLRDFAGGAMATSGSLFLQHAHGFSPKLTGLALSGIFIASAISNPLFGRLSDGGRIRWMTFVLLVAAALVWVFPRVPVAWMVPVLIAYGFFFLSSYPMSEAALMEAVPDVVRGRIFGLFITLSGLVSNLSHWLVGDWVEKLGPRASVPASYFPLYGALSLMVVTSLTALPFLHGLRKREHLEAGSPATAPLAALHSPDPP
jgi:MFS transporter, FSR family, fosmidomycin resistance protein